MSDPQDKNFDKAFRTTHAQGFCQLCNKFVTNGILHHSDPSIKTKEPRALAEADVREKSSLIFVCRKCHGKIHKKLQPKRQKYKDEFGKTRYRKPYVGDNPEGAIWK